MKELVNRVESREVGVRVSQSITQCKILSIKIGMCVNMNVYTLNISISLRRRQINKEP